MRRWMNGGQVDGHQEWNMYMVFLGLVSLGCPEERLQYEKAGD